MSPGGDSTRISNRCNRENGDITKAKIIEAAGRLFAERGFADTTSKEICEAAGVNVTAVNYHFCSREGVYLAVIKAMHNYLASPDSLLRLDESDLTPKEKLGRIVDSLVAVILSGATWQTRLWAREIISPSAITTDYLRHHGMPLLTTVKKVLAEVTGMPPDSPEIGFCHLQFMSPIMVLLILGRRASPHHTIYSFDRETIAANMKEFAFAGLDAFIASHRDKQSAPVKAL